MELLKPDVIKPIDKAALQLKSVDDDVSKKMLEMINDNKESAQRSLASDEEAEAKLKIEDDSEEKNEKAKEEALKIET